MQYKLLIPNIFYSDIHTGLKLFVDCLNFDVVFEDLQIPSPFCVVKKDGIKVHLIQDGEFAAKDRPELRIETDDIDAIYNKVAYRYPELIHPSSKEITLKPWGAKEFALRDESDVCIIFQQWEN